MSIIGGKLSNFVFVFLRVWTKQRQRSSSKVFGKIFNKYSAKKYLGLRNILPRNISVWEIFCQEISRSEKYSVEKYLCLRNILSRNISVWEIFCQQISRSEKYSANKYLGLNKGQEYSRESLCWFSHMVWCFQYWCNLGYANNASESNSHKIKFSC